MVFCTKCGTKNEDGSGFCVVCGSPLAPQQNAQPIPAIYPTPPEFQHKMKKPASTGKRLTAAILVILLIAGLAAGGVFVWFHVIADGNADSPDAGKKDEALTPSALAERFFKLYYDEGDGEAVAALCNPDALEGFCDKKLSKIEKAIASRSDDLVAELDASYQNDWEFRCELGREKSLSSSKLKKLQARYDELDLDLTLEEAVTVNVTVAVEVDGDVEDEAELTLTAVKIDGNWLLDALALSEFLDLA